MKNQKTSSRLGWSQLVSLAGFAVLALTVVSINWSTAQGQETPKAKAKAKAKEARKKTETAQRPTPGHGQKLDAVALTKVIDQEISRRLKEEGVPVSPKADDAEFYRRLSLDLVGTIPSHEKILAFLDSKDPNKRAKAIDELLADERFGKFYGEIWAGMMMPRESNNRRLSNVPLQTWLANEFNKNVPLNTLVADLLTSKGNQDENGAVTYFIGNPTVDKITDSVSRMFLGVQLQCAQCHNHPFTDWKQKEYWGMAQFFMKVRLTANPNQAAKKGIAPGILESDKTPNKKNMLPESAMKVSAKFLGGAEPKMTSSEPYRPVLAKWLASPDNPYFARAMVNRFWHHVFGRGLVNPVDDMHENNTPSHPELLSALTEQFKTSGFDLRYLLTAICNSEAYQRTSVPSSSNSEDHTLYSHRTVRAMLPEQLYDSVVTVLGADKASKRDAGPYKKGGGGSVRDQFVNFFRVVEEPDVTEYQSGIPQALRMMNSNFTNNVTAAVNRSIKLAGSNDPAKVIEQIYLTGLSRRPTADETRRMTEFFQKHATPANAYNDMLWAILNTSEFVLNH